MSGVTARRVRLDTLLVERAHADTRAKAQALIRSGRVFVAGERLDKPGMTVARDADVRVAPGPAYVGRGGAKLAPALDALGLDVRAAVCLDVGASTGGFSDALLQAGARRVYAVDVGRGQLAWRLRQDERVTVLERTDIRAVEDLPEPPSLAVVDVSFISLRLVLPAVAQLLRPDGLCLALVKPQFEAGREAVGKGGIVRSPETRRAVVASFVAWAGAAGWAPLAGVPAALTGTGGNQEYFILLAPRQRGAGDPEPEDVVEQATGDST